MDYGDGETQAYTFDSMGNRLTKSDTISGTTTSESYVVNAANMLTSRTVGGTVNAYANDLNGNTLTGGGRTNTWDSQNRMVSCVNGANTSTFTYGSDGIRHSSVVNGVSTDFVLDSNMFIREMHSGNVKATYFMGQNGPAYRRDDANGGTVRWYLYDGLGSVLGEVDPSGTITARRKYDVYGATRAGSDAGTSKHKFVGQLGHPSEDETGLVYMQARYCDPQTGRFASEDPGKQGANWFAYCNNNPVNQCDADGRIPEWVSAIFLWLIKKAITAAITAIIVLIFRKLILATKVTLGQMLDELAMQLIRGGQSQLALGATQIREAEQQDLTPGGFMIAGIKYGQGGLNEMGGAARIALGVTLKSIAGYLLSGIDEADGDLSRSL